MSVRSMSGGRCPPLDAPDAFAPTCELWTIRCKGRLPPFPVKLSFERFREGTGGGVRGKGEVGHGEAPKASASEYGQVAGSNNGLRILAKHIGRSLSRQSCIRCLCATLF